MSDWWHDVEEALRQRSENAPDPWADAPMLHSVTELTAEQRAFLEQLGAQPDLGRFGDE